METATLGGGCFWCLDAVFRSLDGVTEVTCGYAGGDDPSPTYEEVCTGRTGHAEVVQVAFDPSVLPYGDVLDVFFSVHDPTTKDRQGGDVGTQYRSIVLAHGGAQEQQARAKIEDLEGAGIFDDPIVTQVERLEAFHHAEAHHQDYFARNPETGYCQAVVAPKVARFRSKWTHRLKA